MKPASNGNNGRDSKGKFAPGNKLGRGNPNYNEIRAYKQKIREAFGPAEVIEVLRGMAKLFRDEGNVTAGQTFLAYVIGRPSQGDADLLAEIERRLDAVQNPAGDEEFL